MAGRPVRENHVQTAILESVSTPILGILVVGLLIGVSLLGMALSRRSAQIETLEAHQEVAGFIIAIVGVIYAVLLALVVIAVWEQHEAASATASREADAVAGIYRLARSLPASARSPVQAHVLTYARLVVDEEWPLMQRGQASDRAWDTLDDLWRAVAASDPRSPAESAAFQEELTQLDDLGDARRDRLLASQTPLPPILWGVLIGGAVVTVGFTYFFGVRKAAAQALMTTALAATIGLALFLILALDLPFTGNAAIDSAAMEQTIATLARIERR
jgi:hypothetical protein